MCGIFAYCSYLQEKVSVHLFFASTGCSYALRVGLERELGEIAAADIDAAVALRVWRQSGLPP